MTESTGPQRGARAGDGVPGRIGRQGVQDSLQGEVCLASFGGERHSNNSRCGFLDPPWTHTKIPGHCQTPHTRAQGAGGLPPLLLL